MHKKTPLMLRFWLMDTQKNWKDNLPLTYFKPLSNILSGLLPVYRKWEVLTGKETQVLTEDYLMEKYGGRAPASLFVNSAVLPDAALADAVMELAPGEALYDRQGRWLGYRHTEDVVPGGRDRAMAWVEAAPKKRVYKGEVVCMDRPYRWILVNGGQIERDIRLLDPPAMPCPEGARCLGSHSLYGHMPVESEAVIFDLRQGPVYIGEDVKLLPGSFIQGPAVILDGSMVKAGTRIYNGTTLGPWTKVGGEIKNVLFQGYANKGHDGFLGDSVVGHWCNFGAGTSNSNLKNNYSTIRMWHIAGKGYEDTGRMFLGLVMGDHSKTAINTSLNTGTVIGVSSNIFTRRFPPKFITSFNWGGEDHNHAYSLQKAMATARTVYGRRNKVFDSVEEKIFEHVYRLVTEWE